MSQFDDAVTFVVESGRDRYLFTFSCAGVESFYALTEEVASKAVADHHHPIEKDALPSPMLATAFGHGRHSCPAQLFRWRP